MELREAQEIVLCLPRGRTLFRYFKDRYALYLLGRAAGTGAHVRELKASRYAPLLRRTPVRELAARTPDGILSRDLLESVWPAQPEAYRLRLGIWGAEEEWHYAQISRPGVSLVLRLDFSSRHDRAYRRYVKARPDVTFAGWGHPRQRSVGGRRLPCRCWYGRTGCSGQSRAPQLAMRQWGQGSVSPPWQSQHFALTAQPLPRRCEVDYMFAEGNLGGPAHFLADGGDHGLNHVQHVVVVGVGLVTLQQSELGIVVLVYPLVSKYPAQFIHFVEAPDNQSLQVQFGRDP